MRWGSFNDLLWVLGILIGLLTAPFYIAYLLIKSIITGIVEHFNIKYPRVNVKKIARNLLLTGAGILLGVGWAFMGLGIRGLIWPPVEPCSTMARGIDPSFYFMLLWFLIPLVLGPWVMARDNKKENTDPISDPQS